MCGVRPSDARAEKTENTQAWNVRAASRRNCQNKTCTTKRLNMSWSKAGSFAKPVDSHLKNIQERVPSKYAGLQTLRRNMSLPALYHEQRREHNCALPRTGSYHRRLADMKRQDDGKSRFLTRQYTSPVASRYAGVGEKGGRGGGVRGETAKEEEKRIVGAACEGGVDSSPMALGARGGRLSILVMPRTVRLCVLRKTCQVFYLLSRLI